MTRFEMYVRFAEFEIRVISAFPHKGNFNSLYTALFQNYIKEDLTVYTNTHNYTNIQIYSECFYLKENRAV
jgi:hypothetical protein